MSYAKVGDLVSLAAEHYGEPWIYEIGLVIDDGERPPLLFDEMYPKDQFLVRWRWGDKWHLASDLIIVSASDKELNKHKKI